MNPCCILDSRLLYIKVLCWVTRVLRSLQQWQGWACNCNLLQQRHTLFPGESLHQLGVACSCHLTSVASSSTKGSASCVPSSLRICRCELMICLLCPTLLLWLSFPLINLFLVQMLCSCTCSWIFFLSLVYFLQYQAYLCVENSVPRDVK